MQLGSSNSIYGVEIHAEGEGDFRFSVILLEKKKDELSVVSHFLITSWDELWTKTNADVPFAVVYTGKGIVNKGNRDLSEELSAVFPGIDTKQFYSSKINLKSSAFFQLVRKSTIEDVLQQFKAQNREVVYLDYGYNTSIEVAKQLSSNIKEDVIVLDDANAYALTGNELVLFTATELEQIHIATTTLRANYFNAYAAGVGYWINSSSSVQHDEVIRTKASYEKRKKEEKYVLVSLACILLIVLIATVISSFAQHQLKQLSETQGEWADKNVRDSMIVQIKKQKAFLKAGNWSNKSRLTFYADRIAETKIDGIQFTALIVNPILNPNEDEKSYNFENDLIVVKGLTTSENTLNEWIQAIGKEKFVAHTDIKQYNWDMKSQSGLFELKIKYN